MRRILTLCACVTIFSALALAESFTGRLVDYSCMQQQQGGQGQAQSQSQSPHQGAAACEPTSSTTQFALMASGHAYKFDSEGNQKAAEALKSRADRSANPNAPSSGAAVSAKVTGTKEGEDTIKVESIEIQ